MFTFVHANVLVSPQKYILHVGRSTFGFEKTTCFKMYMELTRFATTCYILLLSVKISPLVLQQYIVSSTTYQVTVSEKPNYMFLFPEV